MTMNPKAAKPPLSLRQLIQRALAQGPCIGRHQLGLRVLPSTASYDDWYQFHATLRSMLVHPVELTETKIPVASTGIDQAQVFEYEYRQLPGVK